MMFVLQNISTREYKTDSKHSNKHVGPVGGNTIYVNDGSHTRDHYPEDG